MDEMTLAALRQVAESARALLHAARHATTWGAVVDALNALAAALITYDAAQAAADAALTNETVPEAWGCPQCGERGMDNLNWDENGEMVTCAACGETYTSAARSTEVAPIPPAEVNLDAEAQRDYLAMVGRSLGLHRASYQ